MAEEPLENKTSPRIVIAKNGSYHVFGEIPLVHKTQVVSEYGEPLTWKKDKTYLVKRAEGRDSMVSADVVIQRINLSVMELIELLGLMVLKPLIPRYPKHARCSILAVLEFSSKKIHTCVCYLAFVALRMVE